MRNEESEVCEEDGVKSDEREVDVVGSFREVDAVAEGFPWIKDT